MPDGINRSLRGASRSSGVHGATGSPANCRFSLTVRAIAPDFPALDAALHRGRTESGVESKIVREEHERRITQNTVTYTPQFWV